MQQKSDTRLVCIFDLAKAAVLASKPGKKPLLGQTNLHLPKKV